MLCITVPMHLYLFPITNHCCIVCLCKAVFTFTSHSVSISAWWSVQNTHGDRVLSGRRGVGEHQTTWLIRQCVDCICFPFVSHRLHWRRSAVIKPLSESEIGESWGERHGSIMRREQQLQNDKSLVEQCREMEIPHQEDPIVTERQKGKRKITAQCRIGAKGFSITSEENDICWCAIIIRLKPAWEVCR